MYAYHDTTFQKVKEQLDNQDKVNLELSNVMME